MGYARKRAFWGVLWIAGVSLVACKSLPPKAKVPDSHAVDPASSSLIVRVTEELMARAPDPEASAHLVIERNAEALAWRLALIDSVEHSLDFQTYLFHGDVVGYLIADRILTAADRGVRVRVLLDDFHLGNDAALVGYDSHPNIEIRIFNPWAHRKPGLAGNLEMLTHLKRLNTRMHNKSIVADNRMSIVGGRNVGDEYLGLREIGSYYDLDVLSAGPVAAEVARSFDLYWNSDPVYPASSFSRPGFEDRDLLAEVREDIAHALGRFEDELPEFARGEQDWSARFHGLVDRVSYGRAEVVYDKPVTGPDLPEVNVIESLDQLTLGAESEVLATTPFFVPEEELRVGVDGLTKRGVRVAAFTNSLASVDSYAAHTGYRPWRKRLLNAGAELYELRRDAVDLAPIVTTPPNEPRYVGLHAKFIVVDRKLAYIGSLNLDPRSIYLNTEMGPMIDDPVLAGQLAEIFDRNASGANSWKVLMDDKGDLDWESDLGVLEWQPARGDMQRFGAKVMGLLPIKKQL